MTNSESEIKRLLENYHVSNINKNKCIRDEAVAKKALQQFTDDGTGRYSIEFNNKEVIYEYGVSTSHTTYINPKKLYDYCVKVGMEEDFWNIVSVSKTDASSLFTENQLSKLHDTLESTKWTIKKINDRSNSTSIETTTRV